MLLVFQKLISLFYLMCISVLSACTSAQLMHTGAREAIRYPGTRVTDGCGLLCGCQEPDLGPLQEKPVLNNRAISPGHCTCIFFFVCFAFIKTVSLWSPDYPGTCFVDQVDIRLRPTCLCLLCAGIKSAHHQTQLQMLFLWAYIMEDLSLLSCCFQ